MSTDYKEFLLEPHIESLQSPRLREMDNRFWDKALLWLCITLFISAAVVWSTDFKEGMRSFDNRLEGTAVEPHGDEDITLLGVHGGFEHFTQGSNLSVRFYLPKLVSQDKNALNRVFVEAREIVDTKHYSMRSKQLNWHEAEWNDFSPWPTKDVIDPLGLDPGNIAVLAGYRDTSRPPIYLPVYVLAGASKPAKSPYTFYFETSWDLHSIEKFVTDPSGRTSHLTTEECRIFPNCVLYSAASSHAFEVEMSAQPEGIYDIRLVGHVPNNSLKPTLHFLIYHYPY